MKLIEKLRFYAKNRVVFTVFIAFVLIIVSISALFVYNKYKNWDTRPKRIAIKLPNGEIIEALRAPRIDKEQREKALSVTLDGKIELVSTNDVLKNPPTRVVIISNTGELVLLVNPSIVNTLRHGGYLNKIVRLRGFWFNRMSFRGKKYRSMWVEEIVGIKK